MSRHPFDLTADDIHVDVTGPGDFSLVNAEGYCVEAANPQRLADELIKTLERNRSLRFRIIRSDQGATG